MAERAIPIGIEDYKEMIEKNYYYVDKTNFIKDLLDHRGKVNLFTRPRRFGKTLALHMCRTFFEDTSAMQVTAADNRRYFEGKKILQAGDSYTAHMGRYPVVFLSLKSAKQSSFEMAYESLMDELAYEYQRHRYVLEGDHLLETNKEKYRRMMAGKTENTDSFRALKFLLDCLQEYHQSRVILLIDEYDVPLEHAYFCGFYERMSSFIRSLFEAALKTNDSLEFAVITGCLRVSKESIFTGLNNLSVHSILTENYSEYFGFEEAEIKEMLDFYGMEEKMSAIRDWYDGYLFGNREVYNPWSVLNYVYELIANRKALPRPYWSNTSSNSIVRSMVDQADEEARAELEILIQGGTIEKTVHEEITYEDIEQSQENLWNFLFFTGYLKKIAEYPSGRQIFLKLAIPNQEIAYIYENTIRDWFRRRLQQTDLSILYQAILEGDCEIFAREVTEQLLESISYYDYSEAYYHGFLCGLLKGCKKYLVRSNRESGNGRSDLVLYYPSARGKAVIMEIKTAKTFGDLEKGCEQALAQIEKQHYEAEFVAEGYRQIIKYGICFYKKECMVKAAVGR